MVYIPFPYANRGAGIESYMTGWFVGQMLVCIFQHHGWYMGQWPKTWNMCTCKIVTATLYLELVFAKQNNCGSKQLPVNKHWYSWCSRMLPKIGYNVGLKRVCLLVHNAAKPKLLHAICKNIDHLKHLNFSYYMLWSSLGTPHRINCHFRNLNWRYLPCRRPYVRGYPHKIWPYNMVQYLNFRILKFPLTVYSSPFFLWLNAWLWIPKPCNTKNLS